MHSLVKMKLQFFFQLCCCYFLLKCMLSFHYVPCSLIVQTYIYRYMKQRDSVLLTVFLFYCWIKLFPKLLLPVPVSDLL